MPKTLKSRMKPDDVHVIVNALDHVMTCFTYDGKKKWSISAHCEGVHGPGFNVAGGDTPPGLYEIREITRTLNSEPAVTWNAYGRYFCNLIEMENQESSRGRAGCGVHGGGSGSPDPLAPDQGFYPTLGCVRLLNKDLEDIFVPMCLFIKHREGIVYIEVVW